MSWDALMVYLSLGCCAWLAVSGGGHLPEVARRRPYWSLPAAALGVATIVLTWPLFYGATLLAALIRKEEKR